MFFWGFDPTYILLIPALIFAFYAQSKVNSTFHRYLQVRSRSGYTGAQVARELLARNGAENVHVEEIGGHLADHYDPRDQVIKLSPEVYESSSLAALGVAAHETGHALQHAEHYAPLGIRNNLFPVANIGSTLAFPLFFIGFLFPRGAGGVLMDLGILLFLGALLFQVITLPVEYNASRRAMAMLEAGGYIARDEVGDTRRVLSAAAMTYVAATAMAALQLVRLLFLRNLRER
ncbi:MAG: zinc metallopeptidase [Firmicutes bacterium]|nr:zinc metallopeptidase [Bacillota bacterium]